MSNQPIHLLTLAESADLDAAIDRLAGFGIRVVCVDTTFDHVTKLTVRPMFEIDLPVIEYAVLGAGIDLLDLKASVLCGA